MAKSKKNHMLMKQADIDLRRRLLDRWDHACIVCGYGFLNFACVTREHVVPRSAPAAMKGAENLAPSHHRCNRLRGNMSIIAAARMIESHRTRMGAARFFKWLNVAVPNRDVPAEALRVPRPQRFLDLLDHLPGIP